MAWRRAEALNWKGMRVGGIVVFGGVGRLDGTSEVIGKMGWFGML